MEIITVNGIKYQFKDYSTPLEKNISIGDCNGIVPQNKTTYISKMLYARVWACVKRIELWWYVGIGGIERGSSGRVGRLCAILADSNVSKFV